MYNVNEQGNLRNRYVKKEAIKMLVVGPVFSFLYIGVCYLSMSKWIIFFYIISPILILLFLLLFVIAPLRMLCRHNRTISSIYVYDENVSFETFQALWLKSKEVNSAKSLFKIKNSKLEWYGATSREGIVLANKSGEKFYIVKDYFDDFDALSKNLKA